GVVEREVRRLHAGARAHHREAVVEPRENVEVGVRLVEHEAGRTARAAGACTEAGQRDVVRARDEGVVLDVARRVHADLARPESGDVHRLAVARHRDAEREREARLALRTRPTTRRARALTIAGTAG